MDVIGAGGPRGGMWMSLVEVWRFFGAEVGQSLIVATEAGEIHRDKPSRTWLEIGGRLVDQEKRVRFLVYGFQKSALPYRILSHTIIHISG